MHIAVNKVSSRLYSKAQAGDADLLQVNRSSYYAPADHHHPQNIPGVFQKQNPYQKL